MHTVILLLCGSILLQQFLKPCILSLGMLHLCAGGLYAGLRHADAGLGGMNAAGSALRTLFGTQQVGLGLGQTKAELGIFDDDERIALLHLLKFCKTDLADKALHPAVLWHDVLAHTSIVRHFATTEMQKSAHGIYSTAGDAGHHDGVVTVG